jgi:FG-GAP repeat protein
MAIDLSTVAAGVHGFVIHGEEAGDASGYSVSSAGDVNGDGIADLIIGANLADGPGNTRADAGAAYVVFGHLGAFGAIDLAAIAAGTGGFVIHGADAGDNAGISVAAAGDINDDGIDDLVVGAFLADGLDNTRETAGDTYVVLGHTGAFDTVNLANLAPTTGFVIHGEDVDDQSGLTAASAGDINGDHIDDLAIGVPSANGAGNASDFAGDTYVVFGYTGAFDTSIWPTSLPPPAS